MTGYYPVYRMAHLPPVEPRVWFPTRMLEKTAIYGAFGVSITKGDQTEGGWWTVDITESPRWSSDCLEEIAANERFDLLDHYLPGLALRWSGDDGAMVWRLTEQTVTLPEGTEYRLGEWPD